MEIICRRFAINPTQRRSRSRPRAGNKVLGQLFLTPPSVTPNHRYLG